MILFYVLFIVSGVNATWEAWHCGNVVESIPALKMLTRWDIVEAKRNYFIKIKSFNDQILESCRTLGLLERGVKISSLSLQRYYIPNFK